MNPFQISSLLSEKPAGECQLAVIVRRRIFRYGDEQNWRLVPLAGFEAGGEI
ncbi:MAG TPA: hypothetical protein VLG37_00655 [Candidatus Saccharimonadales bacterium]|nr:hypothetical protein [Candidatus Saccharimonadales bacterium]